MSALSIRKQKEKASQSVAPSRSVWAGSSGSWMLAALLAALTAVVYSGVGGFGFITMDDGLYVAQNGHVAAGFTGEGLGWAFTTTLLGNWHPLTWISLMADSQFFGVGPTGYHVTNVALHIFNVLLVFFLLRRLTGSTGRSAVVAALFAVHPLHVESVAWISERKDVLSTAFWLLGIWAYARWREKTTAGRYAAVAGAMIMGLLAKPMLVTFPVTLLLLDIWPLERLTGANRSLRAFGRLAWEKVPLFLLAGAFSVVTFWAQRTASAVATLDRVPAPLRLANAIHSYVAYLGKMLWPAGLAMFYSYPATMPPIWETAACLAAFAAITAYAVRALPRHPYVTFGWLWYAVTLIPVIGLVQVGSQALADRYVYVPSLGIFVMAVWGGSEALSRVFAKRLAGSGQPSRAPAAAACGLILALAVAAYGQTKLWKDDLTAWERVAAVTGPSYLSEYNLSRAYDERGRYGEALAHLRNAARIEPGRVEAYNNIAALLIRQGNYGEAESALRTALRVNPQFVPAVSNMGVALGKLERYEEAFRYHKQAVELDPRNPEFSGNFAASHCDLGVELAAKGQLQAAAAEFLSATSIYPDYWQAYFNLAQAYEGLRMLDAAERAYEKSLSIEPSSAEAHNNLGVLLGRGGKLTEAIAHFREALRLKPDYSDAAGNLRIAMEPQGAGAR